MKEPFSQNYANIHLLTRSKGAGQRPTGYPGLQRKRQRKNRIVLVLTRLSILMTGVAAVLALGALAVWLLVGMVSPMLFPAPAGTDRFEAYLNREFGLSASPSLLYYDTLDYTRLVQPPGSLKNKLMPLLPTREDNALQTRLRELFSAYPNRFVPHVYVYNPQNRTFAEVNGYTPVSAASVIKVPILLHYLLALDNHILTKDTPQLYMDYHRTGGAGVLQYRDAGISFPINTVAAQMIRISDNTCTNIMIDALGGSDAVNRKLADLGLIHTRIRNWLPDLEGTNTISAYEMATMLHNLESGALLHQEARQNGLGILESTRNRSLLVTPLPETAKVAHKTGDIGTALGDSGIVYLPDGRKYIISIQVERPFNDYTARDMIQQASRLVYDYIATQDADPSLASSKAPSGI